MLTLKGWLYCDVANKDREITLKLTRCEWVSIQARIEIYVRRVLIALIYFI